MQHAYRPRSGRRRRDFIVFSSPPHHASADALPCVEVLTEHGVVSGVGVVIRDRGVPDTLADAEAAHTGP
jgi:hypothetical protein